MEMFLVVGLYGTAGSRSVNPELGTRGTASSAGPDKGREDKPVSYEADSCEICHGWREIIAQWHSKLDGSN